MSEIIIIEGKIPDSSELYKVLLELSQSTGLSFEYVKNAVKQIENVHYPMLHLAQEYKKASESMKDLAFVVNQVDNFPPSHINPAYRNYKRKRR